MRGGGGGGGETDNENEESKQEKTLKNSDKGVEGPKDEGGGS